MPSYRYSLEVDVSGDERETLKSALEDEPFEIRELIGEEALNERIDTGTLTFAHEGPERLAFFERDIGTISVYLSSYIIGRELSVEPTPGAPVLDGWKVVGRLGETGRLRLDLRWDARTATVEDRDEDVDEAARHFREYPRWLQDALRAKHPRLRVL